MTANMDGRIQLLVDVSDISVESVSSVESVVCEEFVFPEEGSLPEVVLFPLLFTPDLHHWAYWQVFNQANLHPHW
jgi:hypothetical protein